MTIFTKIQHIILSLLICVHSFELSEKTKDELGITERVDVDKILNYKRTTNNHRHFNDKILAYITPWNPKGYDRAYELCKSNRLEVVSPVWFQVRPSSEADRPVRLDGLQNMNETWLKMIKQTSCKVMPRFILEDWEITEARRVFVADRQLRRRVSRFFYNVVKKKGFDGCVVELCPVLPRLFHAQTRYFLNRLLELLHSDNYSLGVVHSIHYKWDGVRMTDIADVSDFLTVNAYDNLSGGGIAPINWVSALSNSIPSEIRSKFLLGINFYGYNFTADSQVHALNGDQMIDWLRNNSMYVKWNSKTAEHSFEVGSTEMVIYPTAMSVYIRLQLAAKMGMGGVAIWELGQGTDQLVDLL